MSISIPTAEEAPAMSDLSTYVVLQTIADGERLTHLPTEERIVATYRSIPGRCGYGDAVVHSQSLRIPGVSWALAVEVGDELDSYEPQAIR
jgi:hypothetical protein